MSFFNPKYQTPSWLKAKLSRRNLIKAAAGASAVSAIPMAWSIDKSQQLMQLKKQDPWLTLDAVLQHLLPSSASGPGAIEIKALEYLYNVVDEQPIEASEKEFIFNGVGWLNGFSQSQLSGNFVALDRTQKEQVLRKISNSRAGHNWINNLINYLYEAMLSPPAYGGNPDGIGWQWLKHQAGFPLPPKGKRFYEIPGRYLQSESSRISVKNIHTEDKRKA